MEKRGKTIETPQLPEPMIQLIQSFLSGKEAAQTTILSKSWYNAWLTRPNLHFNQRHFKNRDPLDFAEFTTKAIQRYKDLNLQIHSLNLQTQCSSSKWGIHLLAKQLVLAAIEMGAVDLNLEFRPPAFVLPQEVLRSPSLLRLSVKWCEIDGNVTCPSLKSLRLDRVILKNGDLLRDIFSCCISIEELSLLSTGYSFNNTNYSLIGMNLFKLHELRLLYLDGVLVDSSFFSDFDSRFPCLKDLTLARCHGYSRIEIASASLQRISFVQPKKFFRANFNVPNLSYFSYAGVVIPYISFDATATEWESCISIKRYRSHASFWYRKLQGLLKQLSSSRITLSLSILVCTTWCADLVANERDIELVGEPVDVEDLIIEAPFELGSDLLVGSFGICRPRFVTHYWLPKSWNGNNDYLKEIWKILMDKVTTPNCGIPDQGIFGRFGLKKVNLEVYEEILGEWRHVLLKEPQLEAAPPSKRMIRFQLIWQ